MHFGAGVCASAKPGVQCRIVVVEEDAPKAPPLPDPKKYPLREGEQAIPVYEGGRIVGYERVFTGGPQPWIPGIR